MIRIFVGYDQTESSAYHVLAHSIIRRSSMPVQICPIRRSTLGEIFTRERAPNESTEFSISRFLTPHLAGYKGWALFMDCDMLCLNDIARLWALRDERYAVMVCKHDYEPSTETKMLGAVQTRYPMKNWSSLMLMDCGQCRDLTPHYVNSADGSELHQFKWLPDPDAIGPLPLDWNWLVGEYPMCERPNIVHWTLGGPYWPKYNHVPYAEIWRQELRSMMDETGQSQ